MQVHIVRQMILSQDLVLVFKAFCNAAFMSAQLRFRGDSGRDWENMLIPE